MTDATIPPPAAGPALLAAIQAVNASAKFNRWAGFEVLSASPGDVELLMPWREEAGQYSGFLHAGLIGALIDTACGFAASTLAGRVLASHFSVNCLRPAVGQRFVARARVVKAGRTQMFTSAELFAEEAPGAARKLVATGDAILVPVAAQ
ncbi:PaaI family thioesterase [Variovorax ginsengisoli]|uniref:PaaI family thioesterase n=1 Tax=Variovorax ginsengisoli TaxID=363844 RepID=A0ABT8S600_9BURK|nr:PaaI family thioesterase [Variovorax ginsengisoli]MDN8615173.1 PaaI family thioesterase [Variovorax ginsengisoli]MDO1534343.1 PaaI family thioesterase [Variovorax ginsengisoli]